VAADASGATTSVLNVVAESPDRLFVGGIPAHVRCSM
jgi:hypothetical protein